MLILSRKVGESIVVPGHDITFTVISVQSSRVRVAISAPAETAIHRQEVWQRICAEGELFRKEAYLQAT